MRDIIDYQEKYKSEPGEKAQVKYRRKHVISIMSKYSHKNILEVGCGLEPLFLFFNDYDSYTIIEPGHDFVTNAQEMAGQEKRKINIIEGYLENSISEIKKMDIKFDYIIVSSLLHELEEPEKMLYALSEIADTDTVIHINVPNANSIHKYIAKGMGLIDDVHELSQQQIEMQRNRVYDLESLVQIVEKNRYVVIEKGSFFPKFLTGAQMDKIINEGIVPENIYEGIDSLTELFSDNGSEIYVQMKLKGFDDNGV